MKERGHPAVRKMTLLLIGASPIGLALSTAFAQPVVPPPGYEVTRSDLP
jgi:hypothetical protein